MYLTLEWEKFKAQEIHILTKGSKDVLVSNKLVAIDSGQNYLIYYFWNVFIKRTYTKSNTPLLFSRLEAVVINCVPCAENTKDFLRNLESNFRLMYLCRRVN